MKIVTNGKKYRLQKGDGGFVTDIHFIPFTGCIRFIYQTSSLEEAERRLQGLDDDSWTEVLK